MFEEIMSHHVCILNLNGEYLMSSSTCMKNSVFGKYCISREVSCSVLSHEKNYFAMPTSTAVISIFALTKLIMCFEILNCDSQLKIIAA